MENHLQKSFSTLFYAFRINSDWDKLKTLASASSIIWQKSYIEVKEQFLLPHVHEYFNYNAGVRLENIDQIDTSQALIFELKPSMKNTRAGASIQKLFTTPLLLKRKNKEYAFRFHDGMKAGLLSPKLIIVPQADVGLLTFSFNLEEEHSTIDELIQFNYACRALYASHKTAPKIYPNRPEINDQTREIFNSICEHSEEEEKPFFSLNELVKFFLADFNSAEILPLSPKRFHIFTFAQTKKQIQGKELNDALFRITRVYNDNYHPPFDSITNNPEAQQTFRDIHQAVSPEGGAIFINTDTTDEIPFLKNYSDSVVKNRYLWIYFMAYIQRIALINTAHSVTHLLKEEQYSVQEVSNTIQLLSKIQIRSMFSEVSHIKMHNDFYNLCSHNFKIPELFNELKNELFDLNMIVQQQFELKRAQQETKEIEREKREAAEKRIADEKQLKFESRLNFILAILGILTFISVWKDFDDLLVSGITKNEVQSFIHLAVIVLVIFICIYFYRKIEKK